MSTVIPNGQIRFLTGVPIDKDYQNELDFLTKDAQTSYFLGLTPVHVMTGSTRVREGVVTVNCGADTILSANYMMFKNMNFFDKWFYAFITNIEYVNTNACNVYYAIDDIQTWLFDVELEECFVEREHTPTDNIFEHLVDEGISTSEYINLDNTNKIYNRYVAILYTSAGSGFMVHSSYANCEIKNGSLKGLTGYVFDLMDANNNWLEIRSGYDDPSTEGETIVNSGNGLEKLNYYIWALTTSQQKDTIVGVVVVPKHFVGDISDVKITQKNSVTDSILFTNFTNSTRLHNNYLPVNKKLYNSPYCLFNVMLGDGQHIDLQPEYLQIGNNLIEILSNISPSPSLMIIPTNYHGKTYSWDKALTFDAFAQASVSTDGYDAWVASGGLKQMNNQFFSRMASDTVSAISSTASSNPVGTLGTLIDMNYQIQERNNKLNVAKHLPSEVKGHCDPTPLMNHKMLAFYCNKVSLPSDVLKSIDDYFTMFGYKVNKVKAPSRRNRPHYTYIKTKGCKVVGGAPADALERIQLIYDNGIRFWVNASEVGKFSTVDNSPA